MSLTITLFGPMRVQVDGQPLPHLRNHKTLWLLALLILRQGRPVEREWLAGMLWPDTEQDRSLGNLRPVLSALRRALGGESERLQSPSRHTLSLDLSGADVDVQTFDVQIAKKTFSALAQAVELYTGPLLEGCAEEWVPQERRVREESCQQALQTLAEAALAAGEHAAAAGYFQRAVDLDPWQEGAWRGLMKTLDHAGDSNAAQQVYRNFAEMLRKDIRAIPDKETRDLYDRLRSEAKRRALKPHDNPRPGTDQAAPVVRGHLPHPLTALIGREEERLEVAARLRRSRLVTLTGPGGIGKTRLAVEVAAETVPEFADGVWLVALEALTDGSQIAGQIAAGLGLKEEVGRSVLQTLTVHFQPKRLLLVLDNCEHLLEEGRQITGHLLRECAKLHILVTSRESLGITGETVWSVSALTAPNLASLPAQEEIPLKVLAAYESVTLFVERAQAVQKTFVLTAENARSVAQICFRLEGLPLAIELAAARVKALTVEQIASRLDDHLSLLTGGSWIALSRQQTLRATLDWSYELLGESERILLRRLSVFVGGGTLPAVEHACTGDGLQTAQIVDLLTSLVDKSLVVFETRVNEALDSEARYRLLETVRQYAAERLHLAGEAALVRTRHQDYFRALAEEAEPQLHSEAQGAWLVRLEAEHANLRASLDWCSAEPDGVEAGMCLGGALGQFWEMRGYYNEGRASLTDVLRRKGAERGSQGRAKALNAAGVLAFYQGDYHEARWQLEEGLAISRERGYQENAAWVLNNLGDVSSAEGDHAAAWTLYVESLTIFRKLDNRQGIAQLLHHLGRIQRDQGNYTEAKHLYEEGLAIQQELGDRQGIAWALHHLGNLAGRRGDLLLARTLQEEGLTIFRELGSRQGVAWTLQELGNAAIDQTKYESAQTYFAESLSIFQELGNQQGTASLLHHLGRLAHKQSDYSEAQRLYEAVLAIEEVLSGRQGVGWILSDLGRVAVGQGHFAAARALYAESLSLLADRGDTRGAALSLHGLAASLLARGNILESVRVWGAALVLRESTSALVPVKEQEMYEQQIEQARAALGENDFTSAWDKGRDMTWDQAVEFALDEKHK